MQYISQPWFDRREYRGPSADLYAIDLDQFKRFLNNLPVDGRQRTSEMDEKKEIVRLVRIVFMQIFFEVNYT